MRNRTDCPSKNLGSVSAGVKRQRQHGTVQATAEESVKEFGSLNNLKRVHAGIEHQQLNIQRRTAKNIGK
ncbi:Uncharacterised protein [Shigella sonnei]|nr:Uncharacterised protein [Shigella sonnei]CSQ69257.1 Uncharacterised protein [Shigella sonnei]